VRIADHRALEFLNTTYAPRGVTHEVIGDGRAFLTWLVDAELLTESTIARLRRKHGTDALEETAKDARALRTWATDFIDRWRAHPKSDYEPEIRKLNALMRRARDFRQLVSMNGRLELMTERHDEESAEILAMLATDIAELVASEDPSLVKRCASSECTLWFLDRTKAHRRRFCSPAACGNREKVAAFRERQRGSNQ